MDCWFRTFCYRCPSDDVKGASTPLIQKLEENQDAFWSPFGRCNFFNYLFYMTCCCGCVGGCCICCIKGKCVRRDTMAEIAAIRDANGAFDDVGSSTTGWSSLHEAAVRGLNLGGLLDAGADPNALGKRGRPSLTASGRSLWIVAGNDDDSKDCFRPTPLHCLALSPFGTARALDCVTLVIYGADPDDTRGGISPRAFIQEKSGCDPAKLVELFKTAESVAANRRTNILNCLVAAIGCPEMFQILSFIVLPYVQFTPPTK